MRARRCVGERNVRNIQKNTSFRNAPNFAEHKHWHLQFPETAEQVSTISRLDNWSQLHKIFTE